MRTAGAYRSTQHSVACNTVLQGVKSLAAFCQEVKQWPWRDKLARCSLHCKAPLPPRYLSREVVLDSATEVVSHATARALTSRFSAWSCDEVENELHKHLHTEVSALSRGKVWSRLVELPFQQARCLQ